MNFSSENNKKVMKTLKINFIIFILKGGKRIYQSEFNLFEFFLKEGDNSTNCCPFRIRVFNSPIIPNFRKDC